MAAPSVVAQSAAKPPPPSLVEEVTEWLSTRGAIVKAWAQRQPMEAVGALAQDTPARKGPAAKPPEVRLTHPERILWPETGLTKQGTKTGCETRLGRKFRPGLLHLGW